MVWRYNCLFTNGNKKALMVDVSGPSFPLLAMCAHSWLLLFQCGVYGYQYVPVSTCCPQNYSYRYMILRMCVSRTFYSQSIYNVFIHVRKCSVIFIVVFKIHYAHTWIKLASSYVNSKLMFACFWRVFCRLLFIQLYVFIRLSFWVLVLEFASSKSVEPVSSKNASSPPDEIWVVQIIVR